MKDFAATAPEVVDESGPHSASHLWNGEAGNGKKSGWTFYGFVGPPGWKIYVRQKLVDQHALVRDLESVMMASGLLESPLALELGLSSDACLHLEASKLLGGPGPEGLVHIARVSRCFGSPAWATATRLRLGRCLQIANVQQITASGTGDGGVGVR